jgi:hypothetical protein
MLLSDTFCEPPVVFERGINANEQLCRQLKVCFGFVTCTSNWTVPSKWYPGLAIDFKRVKLNFFICSCPFLLLFERERERERYVSFIWHQDLPKIVFKSSHPGVHIQRYFARFTPIHLAASGFSSLTWSSSCHQSFGQFGQKRDTNGFFFSFQTEAILNRINVQYIPNEPSLFALEPCLPKSHSSHYIPAAARS